MNADHRHEASDTHAQDDRTIAEFDVILKFSITDTRPLWRAAAQRLQTLGLDADDIEETLGPIDDPTIRDCLLTLTMPDPVDGCRLEECEVRFGGAAPTATIRIATGAQELKSSEALETAVAIEADWHTALDVPVLCVPGSLPGTDHLTARPN